MEFDNFHVKQVVDYICRKETKNISVQEQPTAYLIGGQPGAGKTSLLQNIRKNLSKEAVYINGDAYKKYHPQFKELVERFGDDWTVHAQGFSNHITEKLIKELGDRRYDLIIEGTFRTSETPQKTALLLKEKGYQVEALLLAVNKNISWASTINRYEEMKHHGTAARKTPIESHTEAVRNIAKNVNQLYAENVFDRISICNRNHEVLYESGKDTVLPGTVLEKVINRDNLNEREKRELGIIKSSTERYRIIENLQKSGYKVDTRMIHNMKQINQALKGFYNVEAIKKLYVKRQELPKEKRDLVEKAASDFRKQENKHSMIRGLER